jgi:tRNA pseudouridine38-40 synthase
MAGSTWYAIIQYFGRDFAGWQRQPADRTVQGEFEAVLEQLCQRRVVTNAAGRTDAGVHALGQVASFALERPWTREELHRGLNALLPADIWVERVGPAPDEFHARKHATSRRYRYIVGCDRAAFSPFRRPFEWALGTQLHQDALVESAAAVRGEHDFRALSSTGQTKPHYCCKVTGAEWSARPNEEGFIFTIEADRFLQRMVRFIVGMSVAIALGRRSGDDIGRLLAGTDNSQASPPAPPEGLYLLDVRYPKLEKDDCS